MAASVLVTLAQQQTVGKRRAPTPVSGPYMFWRPHDIARIVQCPVDAVLDDWPLIYEALYVRGIADYNVLRAVIATIAVETAHTFKPVREAFWLSEEWRRANLRYYPYYGRGYIQLTWRENYLYYGSRIGHPELLTNPDAAMLPEVAAGVLAVYFVDRGVYIAARRADWRECRRLVQGADAGLDEFINVVTALEQARIN